jgi:signal transduction histidine kinase/integral membrane sensor domain MASE1/ActR/RegA family two-component response regulator
MTTPPELASSRTMAPTGRAFSAWPWVEALGVAAVYFLAAKLGLTMAFVAEQVTAVWPPTGIALAALLLLGHRVWPGIALGAFLANATTSAPWATASGIAAGNTLEAVVGAWLLRRVAQVDLPLERLRGVLGLIVLAAVASTTVSATIGVASLCLGGGEPWAIYGRLWWVWWLGDAMGALVMAPVLLTWASARHRRRPGSRLVEALVLVVSLGVVTTVIFSGYFDQKVTTHPLAYLIFPFVIWAALRFRQVGTTTVTFITSGIAIWETVNGRGPFATGNVDESLILLQLFMAVVAVTGLLLGAAIAEIQRAERRATAQYATARILADSKALDDAISRLLEAICRNLDWDVGCMWTVCPGDAELGLVQHWHEPARQAPAFETASRNRRFVRGVGLPGRVWATGKPLWLANVIDDTNFPRVAAAAREGLRGAFGVPIIVGGETRGVMEFFSREVRPPDDALLETMAALGHQVGQFIERTRAEVGRERAQKHQALMAEAGRILGSSLDYKVTLSSVCKLVVPMLADWCVLDLVVGDEGPRTFEIAHSDPEKMKLAEELRGRYPPHPDADRGPMKVLRTGEPEHYPEISDAMLVEGARDSGHLEILRTLGLRSAVIVPLKARGRTIGALSLVTAESGRRYDEDDLRLASELASRAALAVDNALLFRETGEAVRVRDEALALHRGIEDQLTLLVEASGSLSVSLDLEAVLEAVLALSRRLISADAYAVWRYRPASDCWGIELASGLSEEYQRMANDIVDAPAPMPETVFIAEDVHESPLLVRRVEAYTREGIRSLMFVPLRVHGSISGTLAFYYRSRYRFSEVEVRVATALSNLVGSAIGTAELYQELRENSRRKDEFLAMLAHELRNPLAAVSNAVTLLRLSPDTKSRDWAIDIIERQLRQLTRLIDDLLDVSRITRGKIQLRKDYADASTILDRALELARPLIEERQHVVTVSMERGQLPLHVDTTRVEQIVLNLLTNAAKYTEDGGQIWLTAKREDGLVAIGVRDNGIGIAPEKLPEMFPLFAQGDRSLARSEGGLGIGLTIVQKLAELHGGSVDARSDGPGKGSEFVVRLPLAERPEEAMAEARRDQSLPSRSRGSRILVVDDSTDNALGMVRLLELRGHEAIAVHDGPSAIEAARTFLPSFVLLDIGLPGMDGYQLAATLRGDERHRGVVIIAVSGYGQDMDRHRSQAAGFDHHLVKPVDFDLLVSFLEGPAQNGAKPIERAFLPPE